jgi:hypothetical protein
MEAIPIEEDGEDGDRSNANILLRCGLWTTPRGVPLFRS